MVETLALVTRVGFMLVADLFEVLFAGCYSCEDLFRNRRGDSLTLDLPKIFGIHLVLAGLGCLTFGLFHASVYPGIWVSDVYGLGGAPTA